MPLRSISSKASLRVCIAFPASAARYIAVVITRVSFIRALKACLPLVGSSAINVLRNPTRMFSASSFVILRSFLNRSARIAKLWRRESCPGVAARARPGGAYADARCRVCRHARQADPQPLRQSADALSLGDRPLTRMRPVTLCGSGARGTAHTSGFSRQCRRSGDQADAFVRAST